MESISNIMILNREIKSLGRERRDLADALFGEITPPRLAKELQTVRRCSTVGGSFAARWRTDEKEGMADQRVQFSSISEQMPEVSVHKSMEWRKIKPAPRFNSNCDKEELVNCFDFILHEVDELAYRMQSVACILKNIQVPISGKINNLVDMTSRLMLISRYIESHYKEDYNHMKSAVTESAESAKEEMDAGEALFADHRDGWESTWGEEPILFGGFQDITTLSSMHFTHCTPGRNLYPSVTASTLQIYCIEIKIDLTKDKLKWPLYVYGVVAARDTVDRNRNLLFCRSRVNCQKLTSDDPFLCLTGPSRAIVAIDSVDFEAELKIKDIAESQDRALISAGHHYAISRNGCLYTASFSNDCCEADLRLERLANTVQATILGVRVVDGTWPLQYAGRVVCSTRSAEVMIPDDHGICRICVPREKQVVLLDSHGEEMPVGSDGYLHLSRHVLSVELEGSLKVVVQACKPSGQIVAQGHDYITAKQCNISKGICDLGDSKVEIVVAWSRLVCDKTDLFTEGYVY
ncbi:hypothetical protein ACQ4PT_042477 [Festuca glaucescens]